MKRAFTTKRLNVFIGKVKPMHLNAERDLFVAFRTDEDRPLVCATALVHPQTVVMLGGPYVDWLEVTSEYRRQGFATELKEGIQRHYGCTLVSDGGSDEGDAFLDAWNKRTASK